MPCLQARGTRDCNKGLCSENEVAIYVLHLWASYSKLSVNTAEESHTIELLFIQIDNYETCMFHDKLNNTWDIGDNKKKVVFYE